MSKDVLVLEEVVRASFAGVVWSHKIHEKQAYIYDGQFQRLELMRLIASALASVGIISLIFVDELWVKITAAFISFVVVLISAFFKSFNTQTLSATHRKVATSLLIVRDKYLHLLLDISIATKSYSELNQLYLELEEEKHQAYADAPTTSNKAVAKAKTALEVQMDNCFSDDEIDRFLPAALQRGK